MNWSILAATRPEMRSFASLHFEMLSGGEPAFMLRGPASSLKRCLGTGEAGYFSTFASLLIKDMVADLEDADKIPMAKSL